MHRVLRQLLPVSMKCHSIVRPTVALDDSHRASADDVRRRWIPRRLNGVRNVCRVCRVRQSMYHGCILLCHVDKVHQSMAKGMPIQRDAIEFVFIIKVYERSGIEVNGIKENPNLNYQNYRQFS